MEERILVDSPRPGDRGSLDSLVHSHQDVAYNIAYRILGDAGRAAAATQEALREARRVHPGGRSGEAWLLRHVVGACRRRSRLSPWPLRMDGPFAEGAGAAAMSPELALQAGISRLPWDERVALVLVDVQGLSYDEAAAVTGTAHAAVKRYLGQARARLRDFLQSVV